MALNYISIFKDSVPYEFSVMLEAELFRFIVRYNKRRDIFTVDLFKDENLLVQGEPLIYGFPLFGDVEDENFPIVQLVPLDEARREHEVTFENLNKTVFLAVMDNA